MASTYLYTAQAGTLIKFSNGGKSFITIPGLDLAGGKLVATAFKVDYAQDIEFQKALSGDMYGYTFGDNVTKIELSGLAFFMNCDPATGDGSPADTISNLNKFYKANSASSLKKPITISIGTWPTQAYLAALSINIESSEFNYAAFSLSFFAFPVTT